MEASLQRPRELAVPVTAPPRLAEKGRFEEVVEVDVEVGAVEPLALPARVLRLRRPLTPDRPRQE